MNQRNRQTREQAKREKIKTALMAAALIVLWAVLAVLSLRTWAEHPGEQPISGVRYVATLQNGGDSFGDTR